MLKFLDLCSGIGGGRLGLEQNGMKCVGYSDTSKLACKTYKILHDTSGEFFVSNIKNISKENIPQYDVLIAGFPCQTFSVIGRQEGFDDIRGQIIFTINNILEFSQPKYFILENVKGLVTHNKGQTYKTILKLLSDSGYHVFSKVLTTLDYGVPQMRQRIYFVGIRNDIYEDGLFEWPLVSEKKNVSEFFLDDIPISDINLYYFQKYLINSTNKGKYTLDDILEMEGKIIDTRMNDLRIYDNKMPTLRAQRDGIYYVHNHKLYQLSGIEALLFQGFSKDKVALVKDVVSDRHLLMQAGNAMSVNVIKALGYSIMNYNNKLN